MIHSHRAARRTKIVATLGPASWHEPVLQRVLEAGVDIVRLNFSHGTHDEHAGAIERVRAAERRHGRPVAILQDLSGPKLRIGRIDRRSIPLRHGQLITLDPACVEGDGRRIGLSHPGLAAALKPNSRLLLDDGRVELRVKSIDGEVLLCRVVRGDKLGEHKGVNIPGIRLPIPAVTPKDLDDMTFGIAHGVDLIAISFVDSASDVVEARHHIRARGGTQPVIAKLERLNAVRELDSILEASDGVMIARGDMAVEISPEEVPIIQKRAIARAMAMGKPIITATQMLESMISSTRPTRAEASDVANAILDGTDAVMLSEETATGSYPVETVETMHRIALRTERAAVPRQPLPVLDSAGQVARSVALSGSQLADSLGVACLIVFSQTGQSARHVSKCRPRTPTLTVTTDLTIARRIQLLYGAHTVVVPAGNDTDHMLRVAEAAARQERMVRDGDRVVVVFGQPIDRSGSTNTVQVHEVANAGT